MEYYVRQRNAKQDVVDRLNNHESEDDIAFAIGLKYGFGRGWVKREVEFVENIKKKKTENNKENNP